jgi:hypothetical protein
VKTLIVVLLLCGACYAQHVRASDVGSGRINGEYNAYYCSNSPAPTWCRGSDIGAWVNAAAAQCNSNTQCIINIPAQSQLTITTPIVFVANETLKCPASNAISSTNAGNATSQLYYNGIDTAITMNSSGGRLEGCDILLGSSVATGVLLGGTSNYVRDVGLRQGGSGTALAYISGAHGGATTAEDNHIEKSRFSYFTGTGIKCDNANDNYLTDDVMYGNNSSSIGTNILMDSACTGTYMTNVTGGYSEKNFLKVQYTLEGTYPTYLFARNTQCDLASGDCYDFDSTLGSALIDYTFVDCWAAGATGRGFHISGGSNIRLIGCKIRTNGLDGILIDSGSNVSNGIYIDHNLISANNQSNTASTNGITVSGHPVAVSIIGNFIQNAPEPGGNQAYAFSTSSDIEGLIFAENFCSNNVTGCANLSSVTYSKLTYYGNIALSSGVNNQVQYYTGTVEAYNVQANVGGACASGNFSLGTGWGSGATTGTYSGYSQTCQFTITSGASSFASAPTFTFTFPTPFNTAPVCTAQVAAITGSGGAIIFSNTTASATAPVFTATTSTGAAFIPAASETYTVVIRCGP